MPHRPEPAARVLVVHDPEATSAFRARTNVVRRMVDRGITEFTGKPNASDAWRSLVSPEDVVGIKILSAPGPDSGTRVAVVAGVVEGLLAAGLPAQNIIVWDKHLHDLRLSGHSRLAERYGVRLLGAAQAGYDEEVYYENPLIGNLVWGDLEFGRKGDDLGRRSFVTRLLTREITRIINLTPMLNHNQAGVAGNLLSLAMGSVDNTIRFEHQAEHLAVAIPELVALPELYDRIVLNIVDALICQYQGEQRTLLHYSVPLNQLRFSTDPVALDVLSIQELTRQREAAGITARPPDLQIYQNASLLELGVSTPASIRIEQIESN